MGIPQTFDKERIAINLVKLKKGGKTFEINVDPDLAVSYKEGKELNIRDVLKAEKIFQDAMKGLIAGENDMKEALGTTDILEAAETIIKEGDIQLSQEFRKQLRARKKRQIIDLIHRDSMDPRTKAPHPVTRIENAFEEANVHINEFKTAKQQVEEIVGKIRHILPISFEKKKMVVKIPSEYAPRCYGTIKDLSKILKEDWLSDGSLQATIEFPAGLIDEIFDRLKKITQGNIEITSAEK